MSSVESPIRPLALCLQPACVKHRWIRTSNASHIYERPERIRAVLLGAAAAISRLEAERISEEQPEDGNGADRTEQQDEEDRRKREETPDVSDMLGNLNLSGSTPQRPIKAGTEIAPTTVSPYIYISPPESTQPASDPSQPRLLQTHPALQVVHSSLADHNHTLLDLALASQDRTQSTTSSSALFPQSPYLKQLSTWALEAPEKIKKGECEIPSRYYPVPSMPTGQGEVGKMGLEADLGIELNQNDLYLAPGSVEAIEGCVSSQFLLLSGPVGAEILDSSRHLEFDLIMREYRSRRSVKR
jgi:histone deacetylase HOS3